MPINKAQMKKMKDQQAARAYAYRMKSMSQPKTETLYDVVCARGTIIKRRLTLSECGAMGKGFNFVPAQ